MSTSRNPEIKIMIFLLLATALVLINQPIGWAEMREIRARIYLKKSAVVVGEYVKLGEIARFEGEEEVVQKLKEIKIIPSPRPGNSRLINIDYIWVRLYQNGISQKEVLFEGEREVRITPRFKCIKGEEIARLAKKEIFSLFKERNIEVEVEVERVPSSVTVPFGEVNLKVEIPSPFYLCNSAVIPVKIYIDEEIYQTVSLLLKIRAFKEVLVTSRRIAPDHIFTEEDIRREKREISSLSGEPVINLSDVLGKRALKAIPAHTIIEESMIGSPLLVKKGDLVTILREKGNIEVLARGKALEKGEEGNLIRVLNIDSQKELQGRVIGPRAIRIE